MRKKSFFAGEIFKACPKRWSPVTKGKKMLKAEANGDEMSNTVGI